jgi:hypothetical protein
MLLSNRWRNVSENSVVGMINDLGDVMFERSRDVCHSYKYITKYTN